MKSSVSFRIEKLVCLDPAFSRLVWVPNTDKAASFYPIVRVVKVNTIETEDPDSMEPSVEELLTEVFVTANLQEAEKTAAHMSRLYSDASGGPKVWEVNPK